MGVDSYNVRYWYIGKIGYLDGMGVDSYNVGYWYISKIGYLDGMGVIFDGDVNEDMWSNKIFNISFETQIAVTLH